MRVPFGVPGRGVWGRVQGGGGGRFSAENEGKGEGGGEEGWVGWGQAKEPASQCIRVCQNYPLAICLLVSHRSFFSTLVPAMPSLGVPSMEPYRETN